MLGIMKESAGNVVGIRATGMLTTADYDRVLIPKLEELSEKFETLRVLFYMDQDFRGSDLSAAWANTKLDFRFRGNLHKVAIVGAPAWEVWCVRVASVVMKGELQTFRAEQLEEAWVGEVLNRADGLFQAGRRWRSHRRFQKIDRSLSIVAGPEQTADRPNSCLKSRARFSDGSLRRFFVAHRKNLR